MGKGRQQQQQGRLATRATRSPPPGPCPHQSVSRPRPLSARSDLPLRQSTRGEPPAPARRGQTRSHACTRARSGAQLAAVLRTAAAPRLRCTPVYWTTSRPGAFRAALRRPPLQLIAIYSVCGFHDWPLGPTVDSGVLGLLVITRLLGALVASAASSGALRPVPRSAALGRRGPLRWPGRRGGGGGQQRQQLMYVFSASCPRPNGACSPSAGSVPSFVWNSMRS